MQVIDTIIADPVTYAVVVLVTRAILFCQSGATYTEYRAIHRLKRRLLPALGPPFVHAKGGQDDAEYLRTVALTPRALMGRLTTGDGSPHLVNSVKVRRIDGAVSRVHVVWRHGDGMQTEAYAFVNPDGTMDVYAHAEPSVLRLRAHLDGSKQVDGDPRGVVSAALDA